MNNITIEIYLNVLFTEVTYFHPNLDEVFQLCSYHLLELSGVKSWQWQPMVSFTAKNNWDQAMDK